MNEMGKLGGKLLLLTAVAGLVLGLTNAVTVEPIAQQAIAAATAARQAVLPAAETFTLVSEDTDGLDEIYEGLAADGSVTGYTGTIRVTGYGGPIEVTVGVSADGTVSGVNVGGTDFAETAGLGAKTKEPAFYGQFAGIDATDAAAIAVRQDGGQVDAVSSATISSRAVTGGVRTAAAALTALLSKGGN